MDSELLRLKVARLGKALADPKRIALLEYLIAPDLSVCCGPPRASNDGVCNCELQQVLGIPQATVSYHVRVLREAGLVTEQVRGKWTQITIEPRMASILSALFATIEQVRSEEDD